MNKIGLTSKADLIATIKELESQLSGLGGETPMSQTCETRIIELCHQLRNLDQVEMLAGEVAR